MNFRLVACFVESFPVSVSYTVAIVDVLVVTLASISDADRDLEVYFDERHRDDVASEIRQSMVRCHAPAIDCN